MWGMIERSAEEILIRKAMERSGVTGRPMLADLMGISDRTLKRKFREPEKITLWELRRILSVTGMEWHEVLDIVYGTFDV